MRSYHKIHQRFWVESIRVFTILLCHAKQNLSQNSKKTEFWLRFYDRSSKSTLALYDVQQV